VAGIDSIYPNHHLNEGTGPGRIQENTRRKDSEEAARMAGIDFVVNALINADCDVARIVCGDVVEAHRDGIKAARKHYVTEVIPDADVSIGNGYPMADEAYKALHIARESVRPGGDLVFLIGTRWRTRPTRPSTSPGSRSGRGATSSSSSTRRRGAGSTTTKVSSAPTTGAGAGAPSPTSGSPGRWGG